MSGEWGKTLKELEDQGHTSFKTAINELGRSLEKKTLKELVMSFTGAHKKYNLAVEKYSGILKGSSEVYKEQEQKLHELYLEKQPIFSSRAQTLRRQEIEDQLRSSRD